MRLQLHCPFSSTLLGVVALLLSVTIEPLSAQTTSLGTITGVATDQTSAVVPDATVTIKDTATGEVRTTNSNDAGRYVFVNVHPGVYDITVVKPGFSKVSIPREVVELGQLSTRNVTLAVGANSQTVVVTTTGIELQTDNATIAGCIDARAAVHIVSVVERSTLPP